MNAHIRKGSALLEVIAALTILVISGVAGAALSAELSHTVASAQQRDRLTVGASALLTRVSLWPRARLDAAVGVNRREGFSLSVQRIAPTLYQVDVTFIGDRTSLVTSILYRPEEHDAPGA